VLKTLINSSTYIKRSLQQRKNKKNQPSLNHKVFLLGIPLSITKLVISKNLFKYHYVIGKGGFGKVNLNFKVLSVLGLKSRMKEEQIDLRHEGNVKGSVSKFNLD